jgi:hypothetical protein
MANARRNGLISPIIISFLWRAPEMNWPWIMSGSQIGRLGDGLALLGVVDVEQPPRPWFSTVDVVSTPCVVTADLSFRIVA